MSRDVPTRTPLVAMDTAGLLNAAPKGEEMRGDGTPLSSTPQDIVPKPSTPGSQWRAAMNSPVPEAEFRKDFRSDDGGDEDEEVGGVAPSEKLRNLAARRAHFLRVNFAAIFFVGHISYFGLGSISASKTLQQ